MRAYERFTKWEASWDPPLRFYDSGDFGSDATASLIHDDKPSKAHDMVPNPASRHDAARVLRFWRRFHKSGIRHQIVTEVPAKSRVPVLGKFLEGYSSRLPNEQELRIAGELLSGGALSGAKDPGGLLAMAAMVSKYMSKIPQTFLDYFAAPQPKEELQQSDDQIVDMEAERAGPFELLPRERYLPKLVKRELRARGALTRWQWLDKAPSPPVPEPPKVQFLIDSSGSMGGEKFALAIAASLRLSEAAGREPTIRFVANYMSRVLKPAEALVYATQQGTDALGGSDDFGTNLVWAEAEDPEVMDFVIVSDFATEQYFARGALQRHKRWRTAHAEREGLPETLPEVPKKVHSDTQYVHLDPGKRMHAIGIGLVPDFTANYINPGLKQSHPWWFQAKSRHDFTILLRS